MDQVVDSNRSDKERQKKESFIRRTTVAYGIAELLKRSQGILDEDVRIDNFVVSVTKNVRSSRSGDDIKGVGMITSGLSLTIEEPFYLSCLLEGEEESDDQIIGRCYEVELTSVSRENLSSKSAASTIYQQVDSDRCHLFAGLLYELFTNEPFPDDALAADDVASTKEPAQKKAKSNYIPSRKKLMLSRAKEDFDRAESPFQMPSVVRMQKLGIPASICLMTQNLLECALNGNNGQSDDAYESFGDVCADLHLLLLDPDRFLFDDENQNTGNVKLLYRRGKLYGRDKEETLITDAFCRVSRGKSEAFFIGGFSGSGKSMLVNSLTDRVDVVGGYVIKHKFDPMSRERPLFGIISAFNQICQMIKDRRTRQSLGKIGKKLRDEFGVDFSLLMRLLPNVSVLCSEFVSPTVQEIQGDNSQPIHERESNTLNVRSVCYTLLRFMRVVSSPHHPIMLFLDDLQWADSTALDVIHAILSDTMGSCMFFVGTYRHNEVQVDHNWFDLMEKLEISNVPTTKVSLTGLDQKELNTMISDALCLYPRICKPLSGIVFQKTKGSPFFVLEFIESLRARGLLQYNFHQKRWVWNMDIIRGEEITDNVLHLLSSKMNGLSDDVRTLLKVMACFGTSTNASVIGYLSESVVYSGFRDRLEVAICEGFIEMDGGGNFKFVHDKVREAAYDLIPDSYKKQFHYDLGKLLYSICDGRDVGDTIFLIASQINHGKESIQKDKDLSIAVAKLNMKAGKKAIDGFHHKTAYSYFGAATSLLPEDSWESYYDLRLSLNFLMASAANSCCQYEEADLILRQVFEKSRCFEDQLSSYFLLSQILLAQGKVGDAYSTCSLTLTKVGESIPDTVTTEAAQTMMKETLTMYKDGNWLQKKMEDENLRTIVKFYGAVASAGYFCKSNNVVVYLVCTAVQLSLRNGICQDTPPSLLLFTAHAINDSNAASVYPIAQNAMRLFQDFELMDQISGAFFNFYGRIAWRFEPFQVCADNLRRGFESGLSSGHADIGFYCSFQAIKTAFFSGTNLTSLLIEIDYYLHLLETYKSELMKNVLLIFRDTVSTLMGKEHATGIESRASIGDLHEPKNKIRDVLLFHRAIRAYWSGYAERCHHCIEKCMPMLGQDLGFFKCQMEFYYGLNAAEKWREQKSAKSKEVVRNSISAMRNAATNSDWNFANKLYLLEAEQQSLSYNHPQAMASYDASIASAEKSGFIHEQGLACEKAGFYYKKIGDGQKASDYFNKARQCYSEWGSSLKVDFIQKELNNFFMTSPS